jgi:hypothetical protein
MGNDFIFSNKFCDFFERKIGDWIFFFLVQVWLIFLFKKNHQNSLYHKIGNKKKTLVKLGQTQPRKDPSIAAPGKKGD